MRCLSPYWGEPPEDKPLSSKEVPVSCTRWLTTALVAACAAVPTAAFAQGGPFGAFAIGGNAGLYTLSGDDFEGTDAGFGLNGFLRFTARSGA